MTKKPVMLESDQTLVEAARQMRDENVGPILVMKDGRLCGIVTDRDITVRAVADGKDPKQARLEEICSQELVTISPEQPVPEAIELTRKGPCAGSRSSTRASPWGSSRSATWPSTGTRSRSWPASAPPTRTDSYPDNIHLGARQVRARRESR
jgi:CBS domain-containing protein